MAFMQLVFSTTEQRGVHIATLSVNPAGYRPASVRSIDRAHVESLRSALLEHFQDEPLTILLNLEGVSAIDVDAARALSSAKLEYEKIGGQLLLHHPSEDLKAFSEVFAFWNGNSTALSSSESDERRMDPVTNSAPPGTYLARIAERFCTRKTYERVFEPLLTDLQYEYFHALHEGGIWKARRIRILYTHEFFRAAGFNITTKVIQRVLKMFRGA